MWNTQRIIIFNFKSICNTSIYIFYTYYVNFMGISCVHKSFEFFYTGYNIIFLPRTMRLISSAPTLCIPSDFFLTTSRKIKQKYVNRIVGNNLVFSSKIAESLRKACSLRIFLELLIGILQQQQFAGSNYHDCLNRFRKTGQSIRKPIFVKTSDC